MKFVPKQCKQCPFRPKSAPGWLGSYNLGDIFPLTWKGAPFFCHTSINYENPNWKSKAIKTGKLCTGQLLFANRIHAPDHEIKHEQIREARLKVLDIQDEVECMGAQEFWNHHDPKEKVG